MRMNAELQLREDVHHGTFLHNETFFALAQQRYAYIYDHKGVELHCMRRHERPYRLNFLPYHYLLTSVGHSGWIKWHDVSTGEYVAGYATGHGPCRVLKHNPVNAVSHLGHTNGVVTLWSPAAGKSLVSMFCHRSPVTDLAIDLEGKYMATAGYDGFMKVWDLRMFKCLHAYKTKQPVMSLDISDRGLIAMGFGRRVHVLKDAFLQPLDVTYLQHEISSVGTRIAGEGAVASKKGLKSSIAISTVKFRPFEDVLALGHSHGLSTIVVPGAGEPNFDSFEVNPFSNPKQRRELEIQSLLTKLQPDMIGLNSAFIGTVDKDQAAVQTEQDEIFYQANLKAIETKVPTLLPSSVSPALAPSPPQVKNKKRGRNKISAKLRRKQKNVIDSQTIKLKDALKRQQEDRAKSARGAEGQELPPGERALQRFSS
jgi:U3 small nucleolar RNA-associated protein 7